MSAERMVRLKSVEFIHQTFLKEGSRDRSAPFHQDATDAFGAQFVQQVSQAATSWTRWEAEILDASDGLGIGYDGPDGGLALHRMPDAMMAPQPSLSIQDHPQKKPMGGDRAGPPVGQLGVIGFDGSPTHDDRFGCPAKSVGEGLDAERRHRRAVSWLPQSTVRTQGQFQGDPGQPRPDELEEGRMEACAGFRQDPFRHLAAMGAEDGHPSPIHSRIGVQDTDDDPADASSQEGLGARGGATMVAAGLQRDVGRRALRILAPSFRIPEGHDFPVGIPGAGMGSLPQDPAIPHQHATHGGVGAGEAHTLKALP